MTLTDDTGTQVGDTMVYDPDGEILAGDVNETVHLWNDAAGLVYNPVLGQYESGGGVYDPVQGRSINPQADGPDDELFYYAVYQGKKQAEKIELDRYSEVLGACQCKDKTDCMIVIQFLDEGDSVKVLFGDPREFGPRKSKTYTVPKQSDTHRTLEEGSALSPLGAFKFNERFTVLVKMRWPKTSGLRALLLTFALSLHQTRQLSRTSVKSELPNPKCYAFSSFRASEGFRLSRDIGITENASLVSALGFEVPGETWWEAQ